MNKSFLVCISLLCYYCVQLSVPYFFFFKYITLFYFTCTPTSTHFSGVWSRVLRSSIHTYNSPLHVKEMDITFHIYISDMWLCVDTISSSVSVHSIWSKFLHPCWDIHRPLMKLCMKGSLMNSSLLSSSTTAQYFLCKSPAHSSPPLTAGSVIVHSFSHST